MKKVLLALLVLVSFISCSTSTSGNMEKTNNNNQVIAEGFTNEGNQYQVVYQDIQLEDSVTPTVAYGEKIGNTTYIIMIMDVRTDNNNLYAVNISASRTTNRFPNDYWHTTEIRLPSEGKLQIQSLQKESTKEGKSYMYMEYCIIDKSEFYKICNSTKLDVTLFSSSQFPNTLAHFTPNEEFCQAVAKYVKK